MKFSLHRRSRIVHGAFLKTFLRITKLIALILTTACLQVSAFTYGQTITLSVHDATLENVFNKIKAQSEYRFWYESKLLNQTKKVTIDVKNASIKQVMNLCLANQPLTYNIIKKVIVIKPKNTTPDIILPPSPPKDTLHGKIINEQGTPVPGATVIIKNTQLATISDDNGYFTLSNVPDDATLVVTSIGYALKEYTLTGNNFITIKLVATVARLDSLAVTVSTGYQEIPKERATGSFAQINNKLFNRSVSTDVISRLKGVTPSLLFDERAGGEPKLSIRGRSTIFANDQPLIVLNNFPYDGDINNINPNDIESVTILKDAAAASIWGVRAGNGVIVITTKKGSEHPLQIEFNSNLTIGERPDLFYQPNITSSDFIDVEEMLFQKGYYDAIINNTITQKPLSPVVEILNKERLDKLSEKEANSQINSMRNDDFRKDLSKYFYRKSLTQTYYLSLKGGTHNYNYYFSGSYAKERMNQIGYSNNRISVLASQHFKPIKKLTLSTEVSYSQRDNTADNTINTLLASGIKLPPYTRLVDNKGNPVEITKDYRRSFVDSAVNLGLLDWRYFPLNEVGNEQKNNKTYDVRLSQTIEYLIAPGLSASLKYQYNRQILDGQSLYGADTYFTRDLINKYSTVSGGNVIRNIPLGGFMNRSSNNLSSNNGRFQLNYDGSWNNHRISAIAGYEVRQIKTDGFASSFYGYDAETGSTQSVNYTSYIQLYPSGNYAKIPDGSSMTKTLDRFRSYFANASYTYNSRYTFSGSARIDQSNLFGVSANQKSVPLWSIGFKWNISAEQFHSLVWLPYLSLRATYGYNGNLDNTVTAYTTARISSDFYTGLPAATITNPPNPELRWEKTGMLNIGVDFALVKNILSGSIEYYHKKGTDLIGNAPLDPTTGFSMYRGNVAGMTGKGIDINITSTNINRSLKWNTTLLLSYTSDKITDYAVLPVTLSNLVNDPSINRVITSYNPIVGKPLFSIYSFKWGGLDAQTGNPMGYINGKLSSDYNSIANNTLIDSLVYNGPALPAIFGSLRNEFNFKGLSLSFNLTYAFGYYFKKPSLNYGNLFAYNNGNSEFSKRWQKPGDEKTTNVPSMVYPANVNRDYFYSASEVNVEAGDHIRLQDISLRYELDKKFTKRLPFKGFQIYFYANNLGLIWKANNAKIDPDFPSMKPPKTFSFGLNIKL